MKQILPLLLFLVCSCTNNRNNNPSASMNANQYQKFNEERAKEELIAIETTFEPTLELTDEIKKTSLTDLILQDKGHYSQKDQLKRKQQYQKNLERAKREIKEQGLKDVDPVAYAVLLSLRPPIISSYDIDRNSTVQLKYIPSTSNLAKIYYLEDMGGFIRNNEKYYNDIKNKQLKENNETQEMKNWDKYLK